jgi:hypothetical protein
MESIPGGSLQHHRSIAEARVPGPTRALNRPTRDASRWLAGALVVASLGLSVAFSGCGLSTSGLPPEGGKSCQLDVDCADDNLCTTTTCGPESVCVVTVAAGVTPDDANACTTDACDGTTPSHQPLADGTACTEGQGTGACKGGVCSIACDAVTGSTVCEDAEPCTVDTCDVAAGQCVRTKLDGTPTPGVNPVTGDCHNHVCVDGADTDVVDLADIPADEPCIDESCSAEGAPVSTPQPVDTPCGEAPLKCDGAGTCLGCTDAGQCPGTFCNPATCVAGSCGGMPVAAGTVLPDGAQTASDCQELQCDGLGNEVSMAADADLPMQDAFQCTGDVCIQGSPQHPSAAIDTACTEGGGSFCDGGTSCVVCNDASQCENPGTCADVACTNNTCVVMNKDEGASCGAGSVCDGNGVCVGCTMASQCADPGECLSPACASNVCGSTPDIINTPCTVGGSFCNGAGSCVACTAAAQCPDPGACKVRGCTAAGACVPTFAPLGTVCGGGACNATGQCVECVSDVNCNNPNEDCQLSTFTCQSAKGVACGSGSECASGFCADGYCCDLQCNALCAACSAAKTGGSNGTCAPVTAGTDPDNECTNPNPNCKGTTGGGSCN